jgi:hypothetical protein
MLAQLMDSNWFSLIYLLVLICMVIAGIGLSRKLRIEESEDWRSNGLLNAIIGFFSLLLAFTLSSSSNSNKERINFIQQHRGAIANLYRQSFLFDDSLRHSVKEYAINAIEIKLAAIHINSTQSISEQYRKSELFNISYLRSMSELAKNSSQSHTGAKSITDEMSKIIDLDAQVHYSNQKRTPAVVMLLLTIGSWTIGFLMGMTSVLFRKRYYLGPIIFTALTSLTVLIIQDMDNPHNGVVRPPYNIYQDLLDEIKQNE